MSYFLSKLDYFKTQLSFEGFTVLTGWGLDYEEFKNGKANENLSVSKDSICISHDGFTPFGVGEDSRHDKLSSQVLVFLKTSTDPETMIRKITNQINDNNIFDTDEGTNTVELNGIIPITFERNNYIFQIDFTIY